MDYDVEAAAKKMLEKISRQAPGEKMMYRVPVVSEEYGQALVEAVASACLNVVEIRVGRGLAEDMSVHIYAQVLVLT